MESSDAIRSLESRALFVAVATVSALGPFALKKLTENVSIKHNELIILDILIGFVFLGSWFMVQLHGTWLSAHGQERVPVHACAPFSAMSHET